MEREDFCCTILKDHMYSAGFKGLSVIPFKNPLKVDDYVFFLQSRSVDVEDKNSSYTGVDVAISYCP